VRIEGFSSLLPNRPCHTGFSGLLKLFMVRWWNWHHRSNLDIPACKHALYAELIVPGFHSGPGAHADGHTIAKRWPKGRSHDRATGCCSAFAAVVPASGGMGTPGSELHCALCFPHPTTAQRHPFVDPCAALGPTARLSHGSSLPQSGSGTLDAWLLWLCPACTCCLFSGGAPQELLAAGACGAQPRGLSALCGWASSCLHYQMATSIGPLPRLLVPSLRQHPWPSSSHHLSPPADWIRGGPLADPPAVPLPGRPTPPVCLLCGDPRCADAIPMA